MKNLSQHIRESLQVNEAKLDFAKSLDKIDQHQRIVGKNGGKNRMIAKFGQDKWDARMSRIKPHQDFVNSMNDKAKIEAAKMQKTITSKFDVDSSTYNENTAIARQIKSGVAVGISFVFNLDADDKFVMRTSPIFDNDQTKELKNQISKLGYTVGLGGFVKNNKTSTPGYNESKYRLEVFKLL